MHSSSVNSLFLLCAVRMALLLHLLDPFFFLHMKDVNGSVL